MVRRIESYPISAVVEHRDDAHRPESVGRFFWPEGTPRDTYTIALNPFTSLRLNAHFPARPETVTIADMGISQSLDVVRLYVGQDVTEALAIARLIGSQSISTEIHAEQAIAMANLQLSHPNTPPALRLGCRVMLDSLVEQVPEEMSVSLETIPIIGNGEIADGDAGRQPAA